MLKVLQVEAVSLLAFIAAEWQSHVLKGDLRSACPWLPYPEKAQGVPVTVAGELEQGNGPSGRLLKSC